MKLWEKIKMGLRFVKCWGKPPAHTHSFSPKDLASMMKDAGFAIKTLKVIGYKTKALYIIGQKGEKAQHLAGAGRSQTRACQPERK
jgi:hypothetical protein